MTSAEVLLLNKLPGIASVFQSMALAVVNLNGWQCLIFAVCVYLIKCCCYHSVCGCGAVSYFVVAACSCLKSVQLDPFICLFWGWKILHLFESGVWPAAL